MAAVHLHHTKNKQPRMTTPATLTVLLNIRIIIIVCIITAIGVMLYLMYFTAFFDKRDSKHREQVLAEQREATNKQREAEYAAEAQKQAEQNNRNNSTKTTTENGTTENPE
jgi:flagellar basal body-associated protein FliL